MKVCLAIGTRPEAIKMAPVYRALAESKILQPVLLSTGQHREMLSQALDAFGLVADHDLELMRPGQTLPDLTARAIKATSDYFETERPDAVLVQGDTTTVLSAAMSAFFNGIPVGHVEAGLRTGNMKSPWPEEMNRRLTSPLCHWNFAPTESAKSNLLAEKTDPDRCFITGNTVVDALLWGKDIVAQKNWDVRSKAEEVGIGAAFTDRFLGANSDPFILVTGHRRESFGQGFDNLCKSLLEICKRYPEVGILFPVHLNPNVRKVVYEVLGDETRIELIDPVGYLDFIWLIQLCHMIISDSGGIQEEAPSFHKPLLVTRETTERPEGVDKGTARLVGTDPEKLLTEVEILFSSQSEYESRTRLENPYGDGTASSKIRSVLENHFSQK